MANLPTFVRSRLALRQRPTDEHPDATLLLGFAEQVLPARERSKVVAHLGRCVECREVLLFSTAASGAPLPEGQPSRAATRRRLALWPAAAALAGLMLAIVLTPRWTNPDRSPSALPPPVAPPTEQPATRAPLQTALAHAKAKTTLRKINPVESPVLETPPVVMPRLQLQSSGFLSMDTSSRSGAVSQMAVKRLVDAPIAGPGHKSVWRIEENGTLSKSPDGKTWATVHVNQQTRLYALSVDGAEVWTGGTDGALFHSTDDGIHWRQVDVQAPSGARLTNSIKKIEFTPQRPVALTTETGTVWVSFDGRLWQQQ
jgi:hypothetical protein